MDITQLIKQNWKEVIGVGIICGAVTVAFSLLLFPLQYEAESQVLVIFGSENVPDAYTAMRSAEKIGESVTTIVETSDFMAQSISNINEDGVLKKTIFNDLSVQARREKWADSVDASLNYTSNILSISTFHKQKKSAEALNKLVLSTLIKNIDNYTGPKAKLKVVNSPLVSDYPVRPNLVLSFLVAFAFGFFSSVFFLVSKKKIFFS